MTQDFISGNPALVRALGDAMDRKVERIPIVEHTFSPAFERRMNRLIRAQSRPGYRLVNTNAKKAVLALAAAILLLVTLMFSVSALREPVVRFIVEVYEKFSQIIYRHDEAAQLPATLEVYYEPAWLPKGYRLDADQINDFIFFCERVYVAENKVEIRLCQYVTTTTTQMDTEGIQTKRVLINGDEGIFYSNKGTQHVTWSDGQYGFSLSGPVPEADLLRMARSLRAVK